jgi:hypothetical protein
VCGEDLQPRVTAGLVRPAPTRNIGPEAVAGAVAEAGPPLREARPEPLAVNDTQVDGTARFAPAARSSAPMWTASFGSLAVAPAPQQATPAPSAPLQAAPAPADPQPELNRCARCASELEEEARFCSYCGTSVHVEDAAAHEGGVPEAQNYTVVAPPRLDTVVTPRSAPLQELPDPAAERARGTTPGLKLPSSMPDFLRDVDLRIVAITFASVALVAAVLVHLFSSSTVPGFTAAEANLRTHVLAAEWLLAGILVALIGLLAKR